MINSLYALKEAWKDEPSSHQRIEDELAAASLADPDLSDHLIWCRENSWGYGENAFWAFWKLVVSEMPDTFSFLEIGVYKGQTTSLIGLLSRRMKKQASVVGVSTFDSRGLVPEVPPTDTLKDTWAVWERFLGHDHSEQSFCAVQGDSTDWKVIDAVRLMAPFDVAYLDGDHSYTGTKLDLQNYSKLVRINGYLVTDDSACNLKLAPAMFPGFEGASQAVDETLPPFANNPDWEHLGGVCHIRVWRRLK